MKKSITISVAIILVVVVIALYQGAHNHLTVFDAMLFVTIFFIGVLAGRSANYKPKQTKCGQYADPEFMEQISSVSNED
jgi:hypothetical protein